jgi:hypothetical protein
MLFDVSEKTKEASNRSFSQAVSVAANLRSTTDSSALTLQLAWTFEERDDSVRMTQKKSSRVAPARFPLRHHLDIQKYSNGEISEF